MKKIWRTEKPKREGDFICRMMNAYIKMCHWTGTEWLDMWKNNYADTNLDLLMMNWEGSILTEQKTVNEIFRSNVFRTINNSNSIEEKQLNYYKGVKNER